VTRHGISGLLAMPVLATISCILTLAALTAKAAPAPDPASASAPVYELRLYETHRHQSIDVVYRKGDVYIPANVARLEYFLRDHLNGQVHAFDPRLFDLLHTLEAKIGRPNAVIDVICGYRTPSTNSYLRRHTAGVAQHSLHMLGEAMDIRIPGVPLWKLRQAALGLQGGGVGFYPESDFVHVDVGRVRQWALR
jgi:uncharacterized protein YcbK (DUF882 family)